MNESTVGALAELVGGAVIGDRDRPVRGVNELGSATPDEVGFVRDREYIDEARASRAGAVVVSEDLELRRPQILVRDVNLAFTKIVRHFHPEPRATEHAVHPTAVVDPSAELEQPVRVGPHVSIGAGTRIGAGTVIGAGAAIGDRVRIGRDCSIHARVVIYDGAQVGDRVVLIAGCIIGSDGFGFAQENGRWTKIPHIGTVVIEDDVEIGAGSAVARGSLGPTRIGAGTKIDNAVHVGHNCVFGRDNAIAACCGFAGSAVLGDRVTVAGGSLFSGHQTIGDDVRIGGNSGVHGDVTEPGDYMGWPLMDRARWARTLVVISKLADVQPHLRGVLPKKARKGKKAKKKSAADG